MALTLGDNFSYQGAKPLDARLKYDAVADMKAVGDATMYDGCLAYCVATDKTYQWKSSNTVDATTGKWREFTSGGGGSSSALSDLTDVEITSAADGDVLKYDSTSSSWINGQASGGVSDLDDLGDVSLSSPTDGQVLTYDSSSSSWVNADGGSATIDELGDIGDVDLSSPTEGQTIVWDATNSKWVNGTPAGGVSDLVDLGDVAVSSPTNGQVLTYNSTSQKWENATGGSGGSSYLADMEDVEFGLLAEGQILKYDATNDLWINAEDTGASELNELDDVDITTPADGEVLVYDSTSQKWMNGATEAAVIYGFAAEVEVDGAETFIQLVNAVTPFSQITYSNNLFSGKTANAIALFCAPTSIELLFSEYEFEVSGVPVKQSGSYKCSVSRQSKDGTTHPCYTSPTNFTYSNGITSLNSETMQAAWTHDRVVQDADIVGQWYVTSNVGFDRYGSGVYINNTHIVDGLHFYSDQAHTTVITPEKGKIYIDNETGNAYSWDGFSYKQIGSGGGSGGGNTTSMELTATEYAALTQEEKMNGTVYFITDGEGGGGSYDVKKATLEAGATSVQIPCPSTGDYITDIYTSDGRDYLSATIASNTLTITFEAPSSTVYVYVEFREV